MNDIKTFSHKVRVRVCGLLEADDAILLLKHNHVGKRGYLWSPPGGGVEYGDRSGETLIREFKEETGLEVKIGDFLFLNEFIDNRFHALEIFYSVKQVGGKLKLGTDPELSENNQILEAIRFVPYNDIKKMDPFTVHNAFSHVNDPREIFQIRGLINFINI